ncbi:lymphoid-restricted membrane protein [Myripristis murdjan]|uniref:lymphoid-restricted membrane protein n=1 Tax=Myripristis murdjan TaxID=586833 RepID=UPI001176360A|nr:lymphoid-restricted membrane protein-like [Myripristis murdjan]
MNTQSAKTETTPYGCATTPGDSEDSDDESSPEDQISVSWEDLPIMERLGLTSGAGMTEEEVESAFTQLALAFNCDQYTLNQRLQAEEHERTVAQENLRMEVENSTKTLQTLRGRCRSSEWTDILGQMEASLNTVLARMDDIISAAETLGAVHQEVRASCSVELMQIHMEHLKQRHITESAELLATRKLFHRNRGRIHSDSEDPDVRSLFVRQGSQQHLIRRRVSMTLIPTQTQLIDLEAKFREGCQANDDNSSQEPEEGAVTQDTRQEVDSCPSGSSPIPRLSFTPSCQSQEDDEEAVCQPSPLQAMFRRRRRSAIIEQEGSTEESVDQELPPEYEVTPETDTDDPELPELSEESPSPWQPYLRGALVLLIFLLCFLLLPGLLLTGLKSTRHPWTGTTAT